MQSKPTKTLDTTRTRTAPGNSRTSGDRAKTLSYRIAKQMLEDQTETLPPVYKTLFCGGFIQALWIFEIINDQTADKLWCHFRPGC